MAQVSKIQAEGLVDHYNQSASVDRRLRLYDCIVMVNGGVSRTVVHERLRQDMTLQVRVMRPTEFETRIDKRDSMLGLELHCLAESIALAIKSIERGAIQDYNKSVPEAVQI